MELSRYRATRHFPGLDALRGLAILAVLWHHATPRLLPGIAGRGHLGVQLFFAISGFLITSLLLREQRESQTLDLGRFWLRRALRLFPLYYAVLAAFVLFALCLPSSSPERTHFLRSLPFYLSHTANWFVDARVTYPILFGFAWSLSTEQQFYVVWPALLKWFRKPAARVSILLLLLVVDQLAERQALGVRLSRTPFHVITSFSASIALGALGALVVDDERAPRLRRWLGGAFAQPVLLAVVLALLASPPRAFILFEASLGLLVLSAALGVSSSVLSRLAAGPIGAIGQRSYAVYLLHVPVLGALKRLLPTLKQQPLYLFALGVPLCWMLAELSHHAFEARFRSLRQRTPSTALS